MDKLFWSIYYDMSDLERLKAIEIMIRNMRVNLQGHSKPSSKPKTTLEKLKDRLNVAGDAK
jgi:hypothetical protein